jgi:hypothetical protein
MTTPRDEYTTWEVGVSEFPSEHPLAVTSGQNDQR